MGEPVDERPSELELDMEVVRNLLDSVQAQEGMSGPLSNMMGQLGISLPHERQQKKHRK